MLEDAELDLLEAKCRTVPLTTTTYVASDYVVTLLETVMDYQNNTRTVERAGRAQELRGLAAYFWGLGVSTLE